MQLDLFGKTANQMFDKWVHTSGGRWIANHCIRYAYQFNREGKKRSIKLIWELVREDLRDYREELNQKGIKITKTDGYAMSNSFTAHMARFIEDREPKLKGYFKKNKLKNGKAPKKAVVIPIK